jgi:hypothetical protein
LLLSPKDRTELEQFLKLFGRELSLAQDRAQRAERQARAWGAGVGQYVVGCSTSSDIVRPSASFPTDRWARTINDSREGAHIETGGWIAD